MKIRVGIAGYGNIGRGVELAVSGAPDMELAAVLTRRDPQSLNIRTKSAPVVALDEAESLTGKIDVMVLCGGSATDLPEQGPALAALFNTVDSFDTHAMIPRYLENMNKAARATSAIISVGWDPGLFSIIRMLSGAVLPDGRDYTFWGRGVSQGHSDALRRIDGVKNAVQYTVPSQTAISGIRSGAQPEADAKRAHTRECFVVPEEGADRAEIEKTIKQMPHYFAGYETVVNFITQEELAKEHSAMPHGGTVLRTGVTGADNRHLMEFSLKLDSNAEYTASVMTAYARAAYRLAEEKNYGAKTVFDIPLAYLSPKDRNTLIKELL